MGAVGLFSLVVLPSSEAGVWIQNKVCADDYTNKHLNMFCLTPLALFIHCVTSAVKQCSDFIMT